MVNPSKDLANELGILSKDRQQESQASKIRNAWVEARLKGITRM